MPLSPLLSDQEVSEQDVQLAVPPPFSHAFGMTIILNSGLRAGATVVTMPRFDSVTWPAAVERHRVTWGYLNDPAASAASLNNGWLWMGYRVRVDDHIRFQDVIKCSGCQELPAELEDALRRHENVADVAAARILRRPLHDVVERCRGGNTLPTDQAVHPLEFP